MRTSDRVHGGAGKPADAAFSQGVIILPPVRMGCFRFGGEQRRESAEIGLAN